MSVHFFPFKIKPSAIISVLLFAITLVLAGCSIGAFGWEADTPASTLANTFTPTLTLIPTATPTPTPIPPPEGEWTHYWNSNQIYDLEIDNQGYLWGRGSGTLIRWDTREGTYQEFGVAEGMPSNTVSKIFLGPAGEIWLVYSKAGLWQHDEPDWNIYLEQGEIEGYWVDATAIGPDGKLWICTEESLSSFDGSDWFSLDVEGGMEKDFCKYLTVDLKGNPIMQGVHGVSVYQEPDWFLMELEDLNFSYKNPLGAHTAPNGDLWFIYGNDGELSYEDGEWHRAKIDPKDFAISTNGKLWLIQDGGYSNPDSLIKRVLGNHFMFDLVGGGDPQYVYGYYWDHPFYERMPSEDLGRIYPGINNDMWVTCDEGLLHQVGNTITLIPIESISYASAIWDVAINKSGQVFVVLPDGIYRVEGEQLKPLHTETNLVSNSMTELVVDTSGTLWLDTNRGFQSFDRESWVKHDYSPYDMALALEGDLWIAHTWGVSHWDGAAWEDFDKEELEGLLDGTISSIFVGEDGVVRVGIARKGISSYDGNSWTALSVEMEDDLYYVDGIGIDRGGTVYLATRDKKTKQPVLRSLKGNVWQIQELDGKPVGFSRHLDGSLWMALRTGFFILENGILTPAPVGLPDGETVIRDFVFAEDSSLWIASYQGAFRHDGLNWQRYSVEDGLRSNSVGALTSGPDNTLWFSGSGLTRFGPP